MAKKDKGLYRARGGDTPMEVAGNPNVFAEAKDQRKDVNAKRGGRISKRAKGGKVVGKIQGAGTRARLDRPGRKTGGAVGSDKTPLSTAHKRHHEEGRPHPTDTYGGTPD